MFDEIDKEIQKKLFETEPPLPESYERKFEQLIKELPKRKKRWIPKVAIFIFCCLVTSAGVYAGVRQYMHRLESVKKEELNDINNKVQDSKEDADHYSRELTVAEQELFQSLEPQYKKGLYPKETLTTVAKAVQVGEKSFCYCYENSTFYLPTESMTEEQALQIIDFVFKRDYALEKNEDKNKVAIKSDSTKQRISENSARKMANDFINNTYDINSEKLDSNVTYEPSSSKNAEDGVFAVVLTDKKGKYYIEVDINAYSEKIEMVLFNNEKSSIQNCSINKMDRKNNRKIIERLTSNLTSDVKLTHLKESYLTDGKIICYGKIKYYFYDENQSGYVITIDSGANQISKILRFSDLHKYEKEEERSDKYLQETKDNVRQRTELY